MSVVIVSALEKNVMVIKSDNPCNDFFLQRKPEVVNISADNYILYKLLISLYNNNCVTLKDRVLIYHLGKMEIIM